CPIGLHAHGDLRRRDIPGESLDEPVADLEFVQPGDMDQSGEGKLDVPVRSDVVAVTQLVYAGHHRGGRRPRRRQRELRMIPDHYIKYVARSHAVGFRLSNKML